MPTYSKWRKLASIRRRLLLVMLLRQQPMMTFMRPVLKMHCSHSAYLAQGITLNLRTWNWTTTQCQLTWEEHHLYLVTFLRHRRHRQYLSHVQHLVWQQLTLKHQECRQRNFLRMAPLFLNLSTTTIRCQHSKSRVTLLTVPRSLSSLSRRAPRSLSSLSSRAPPQHFRQLANRLLLF